MMVCRGEIWLVNLNPSKKPNEMSKVRPVVVFQNNMDEKNRNEFLDMIENKLENVSENDIQDLESF